MRPTTAVCPCGDARCKGSRFHGWDPEDARRDAVADRVALRTLEGGLYLAATTLAIALLIGGLTGCASRSGCVDRVVIAVDVGGGWTDALDRACPPTSAYVEWSEYDHENDAVVASCVCYASRRAGVGGGVGGGGR